MPLKNNASLILFLFLCQQFAPSLRDDGQEHAALKTEPPGTRPCHTRLSSYVQIKAERKEDCLETSRGERDTQTERQRERERENAQCCMEWPACDCLTVTGTRQKNACLAQRRNCTIRTSVNWGEKLCNETDTFSFEDFSFSLYPLRH